MHETYVLSEIIYNFNFLRQSNFEVVGSLPPESETLRLHHLVSEVQQNKDHALVHLKFESCTNS